MNAMQALVRDKFQLEAEAYCRRYIPDASAEDALRLADSLRHQAFLREIELYIKAKCSIYNCHMPRITIDAAGRVETTYVFSEETQKALDACDSYIAEIAKAYGASHSARGQQ